MWLVPWSDLTTEQQRAAQFRPDEHRVIFGAPGSGKTMILVHRAAILAKEYHIRPERIQIFVFTNVLKDYIKSSLGRLAVPETCVSTFDHWCVEFHKEHVGRLPQADGAPDFMAVRKAVLARLKSAPPAEKPFDAVLVDEGQDLDRGVFDILTRVGHHVTVCMDHKQQIYEHDCDEAQVLRQLGLRKRNMSLLEAYRCTPYIVRVASSFLASDQEREDYIRQTKVPQAEKETPLFYVAADFEDEKRRLVEIVKARQLKGERIAILFPQKRQVVGFALGLREAGLEVEMPAKRWGDERDGFDFNSDLPKLMPYHSAKGLTFDTVLMPRLVAKSFGNLAPAMTERLMFVGVTRATKWLYFSTTVMKGFAPLDRYRKLAAEGHVTLQYAGFHADSPVHGDLLNPVGPSIEVPDADGEGLASLF